jgi:aminomethyltransferase
MSIKKTALIDEHKKLGAKIIDFYGWQMPIYYSGIISEHHSVREDVAIFDVSHMSTIDVSGKQALEFLQLVTVNDVSRLLDFTSQYSMILDKEGNILDDIIIARINSFFRIVVNSSNEQKILDWFKLIIKDNNFIVEIKHRQDLGIIALQGPNSTNVLEKVLLKNITLKKFSLTEKIFNNHLLTISRTGYTGELGYELFVSNKAIVDLWKLLLASGAAPAGLGARDTLRIEAGLPLYGKEIVENVNPFEMGYGWTVNYSKGFFIGKDKLINSQNSKKLYGCILEEKGVIRDGNIVVGFGKITSGTFSPTLESAIGMFYSDKVLKDKEKVAVLIRNKEYKARVSFLPFIKNT